MTRRSSRRWSWAAATALLAAAQAGACSREPAFLTRSFDPGERIATAPPVSAELTSITYGRDVLRAAVQLDNDATDVLRVDGARATVELEGLHYAAIEGSLVEIPAGSRATLMVEVKLGRRLHVPARLVLHGLELGSESRGALTLELPAAPRPDGGQSGTAP